MNLECKFEVFFCSNEKLQRKGGLKIFANSLAICIKNNFQRNAFGSSYLFRYVFGCFLRLIPRFLKPLLRGLGLWKT